MRTVIFQDPDKHKRDVGSRFLRDFEVWYKQGRIGESYQYLADKAEMELRSWKFISNDEVEDMAHDAALEAWKHLANRHHSCPVHLYNEIALCLSQKLFRLIKRSSRWLATRKFGTRQELDSLGFKDGDDGGIDETTFRLDLCYKLKHDLADFRSKLAIDCLMGLKVTVREIQEYAGFSNYQARELKEIMKSFMENYCELA